MRRCAPGWRPFPASDPAKGTLRFYADAASYVVDPVPYAVAKYRSAGLCERVQELAADGRFDAIVCDFLRPWS